MSTALPTTVRPGSGEMFDRIARRYDLVNRVVSMGIDRRWRRAAARAIGTVSRVLDCATGTGDLAIAIAKQHPAATVVGTDPSELMRSVGVRKLERLGLLHRIALQHGE